MVQNRQTTKRILGIAISSWGFGYAILEGERLVNWGVAATRRTIGVNAWSLKQIDNMLKLYAPDLLVIEDVVARGSVRHSQIRRLANQLELTAVKREVRVKKIPRLSVIENVCERTTATRHDMAERVAQMFPNQLSFRLPRRRGTGDPEDRRIRMFEAVALAVCYRQ